MNLFAKVLQWHRAIHLLALSPQEARFHHNTPKKGKGDGVGKGRWIVFEGRFFG